MKMSALPYYAASMLTIAKGINFYIIPLLFFKRPQLIKLTTGHKFYVENLMDIWTLKEVILDRQYEKIKQIGKCNTVIDIGSSIGDFSILASKSAKNVFSFEADRGRINLMKKNVRINGCHNIDLNKRRVDSLDTIFRDKHITQCDFLKIDCEGAEYPIFKNSHDNIIRKIKFIAMEAHLFNALMSDDFEILKQRLSKCGFTIKEIENPVHSYIKYIYAQNKHKEPIKSADTDKK